MRRLLSAALDAELPVLVLTVCQRVRTVFSIVSPMGGFQGVALQFLLPPGTLTIDPMKSRLKQRVYCSRQQHFREGG
jgi:hypothetical protein